MRAHRRLADRPQARSVAYTFYGACGSRSWPPDKLVAKNAKRGHSSLRRAFSSIHLPHVKPEEVLVKIRTLLDELAVEAVTGILNISVMLQIEVG